MDGRQEPKPENPLTAPAATPAPLRVKTLKCSGCGNSLTLRGMERTESVACEACGSVIDLTDENLRIISTFQSRVRYKPIIPLGSRGKLRGDLFEVIGYLRRAVTVEGVDYEWSEYLLFNPYKGFRWLSEYNGHWNFLKSTNQLPRTKGDGVKYLDKTFLHFQTAESRVVYVLGEFYWKVQAGESCRFSDYIAPPLILSKEQTARETDWSIGEYLEPESLRSAFQLTSPMPARIGVAPNQPSPYAGKTAPLWKLIGYFFLAALFIHLTLFFLAQNKRVFETRFTFEQKDKGKAFVTEVFELSGRPSNVVVRSAAAPLSNYWVYLNMALISEDGRAYDFGREISYYSGTEDGTAWSEGGFSDEATLPAIPAGKYYLRIEPDFPAPRINYQVEVYRDVPKWSFFFMALGALCLLPILLIWRVARFEGKRWAESDHPGTLWKRIPESAPEQEKEKTNPEGKESR
ncbi:MAG: DUF4178 domain-containing protein [Syntrophaceae bacterium]|nr:DUF4178 domain-containing protein [Syntrophaceae bacterium]